MMVYAVVVAHFGSLPQKFLIVIELRDFEDGGLGGGDANGSAKKMCAECIAFREKKVFNKVSFALTIPC